jgi:hypothetical protein
MRAADLASRVTTYDSALVLDALIALAVDLSDRALVGFEDGLAEVFSAH